MTLSPWCKKCVNLNTIGACSTASVFNCFYTKTLTGWVLARKPPLLDYVKAPVCETCGTRTTENVIVCRECADKNGKVLIGATT